MIHSDHGVQFTSWAFTRRAQESGLVPSMGSIGDCYDNAVIESFWGRMQTELLNRRRWRTRIELANALFEYLDYFRAMEIVAATRHRHAGLARMFLAALARAPYDERIRETLAAGFSRTRHAVAAVLGTGTDAAGLDAAGLALALFDGLLFQTLVDPSLAIEGDRFRAAEARLHEVATAG